MNKSYISFKILFCLLSLIILFLPFKGLAEPSYNEIEVVKLKEFLEYDGGTGEKNGQIAFGASYDPNNPTSWTGVTWTEADEKHVQKIVIENREISGNLNLQNFNKLEELNLQFTQINSLDVSACAALEKINCYTSIYLSTINLTGCTALRALWVNDCALEELNVGDCIALESFYCNNNKLTSLEVNGHSELYLLECMQNELTSLKVENCPKLPTLSCSKNNLTELIITSCDILSTLICQENNLTELRLGDLPVLNTLYCYGNNIEILELNEDASWSGINCYGNRLRFSTLPSVSPTSFYSYGGQQKFSLAENNEIHIGEEIDLRAELMVGADETLFKWLDQDGQIFAPVPLEPGLFSYTLFSQGKVVSLTMTNDAFPDLELEVLPFSLLPAKAEISIIGHPEDLCLAEGKEGTFEVEAIIPEGFTATYQWETSKIEPEDWQEIAASNNPKLTLTNIDFSLNNTQYRCLVSASNGEEVLEAKKCIPAALYVIANPVISKEPLASVKLLGQAASFSLTATSPDEGELSFQWQQTKDKTSSWADIDGATSPEYNLPELTKEHNANYYRCQITNTRLETKSNVISSAEVLLTVLYEPRVKVQPEGATVPLGGAFAILTDAEASLGSDLECQWQEKIPGGDWQDISGANSLQYQLDVVTIEDNHKEFKCALRSVKDELKSDWHYTNIIGLRVLCPPVIKVNPEDQECELGDAVSFSVEAELATGNEDANLIYQWEMKLVNQEAWQEIEGAKQASYTIEEIGGELANSEYRCQVRAVLGEVPSSLVSSEAAILTINLTFTLQFPYLEENDEENPLTTNNGSLILLEISGDINGIDSLRLFIDEEESVLEPAERIYFLLPTSLTNGEHTLKVELTDLNGKKHIVEANFYWQAYRRGFGFGRFSFPEN